MAKRGGTKHLKRIAASPAIPIHNRKEGVWLLKALPGTHKKSATLPILVLIREVLGLAKDAREAKKILAARSVEVDGRVRTDPKFGVGLMDVVGFPSAGLYYRIIVDQKSRLIPLEISKEEANKKIEKVLDKHTFKAKIVLRFHDGKNVMSNDAVKVGDSVIVSLPENKPVSMLKLEKGARCLITEGKHAGTIATLEEILEQKSTRRVEAKLSVKSGEFITVAEYLHVVDDNFKGVV